MLRRQSITDASLRQDISRDLYSRQLLAPVSMGSAMSRDMVLPYASLLLEGRTGHIAIVPSKMLLSSGQPKARKSAVQGQSESVHVALGGRRGRKKQKDIEHDDGHRVTNNSNKRITD